MTGPMLEIIREESQNRFFFAADSVRGPEKLSVLADFSTLSLG